MKACIILHNMIVEDESCHRRIVQPIEIYRTTIEDLPV
uniref:Uncharacterized protein n=1 Tax=Physcomitrium patens TaxID=3218 RepID=A0A2K1JPQ7_PHYPA|nr:hypothetical protein PHYPA_015904 [Physcomitrium patens]